MGCRNREILMEEDCTRPASLGEVLLFTTMYLIGTHVDVHVRDGSVYSGIFHTASGVKDYGVVLKKARMMKKGKCDSNVAKAGIVETLVILSGDLVQVVAKGVFPADGVGGNMAGDVLEAIITRVPCSESSMSESERSTPALMESLHVTHEWSSHPTENGFPPVSSSMIVDNEHKRRQPESLQIGKHMEVENGKINETTLVKMKIGEVLMPQISERQAGDYTLIAENDKNKHKFKSSEVNNVSKIGEDDGTHAAAASIPKGEPVEIGHPNLISKFQVNGGCNGNLPALPKPNIHSRERFTQPGCSSTDTITLNVSSSNQAANGDRPDSSYEKPAKFVSGNSNSKIGGKEFKLNPGAKIFSPSLANPMSATHSLPAVANITYVPNSSNFMTVPAVRPEVGFSPYRPLLPVKFSQHSGSMTAGNGCSTSQFSNPVIGHMGQMAQTVRYAGNYNPVLADPAYLHPSAPPVMVGQLGQLVYVHPIPPDLVQGAATIAPASARPLLTPNHVQIPKQHGQVMQYFVPPAAITSGLQPYPMPSNIPVLQPPFPPGRPIPVPGSNGFYGTKL